MYDFVYVCVCGSYMNVLYVCITVIRENLLFIETNLYYHCNVTNIYISTSFSIICHITR